MEEKFKILVLVTVTIIVGSILLNQRYGGENHDINKTLIDNRFEVNLPEGQTSPEETVIVDGSQRYYFNERKAEQAYDCSSNKTDGCVPFRPEKSYLECEKVYLPKDEMESYCETTANTAALTLKTDERFNHITAPITEQRLNVTTHEKILKEDFEFLKAWDLEIINDSRFLVTGLDGEIYDVVNGDIQIYNINVLREGPRNSGKEDPYTGLMGVTKHPNFTENNIIYLHYSYNKTNQTEKPFVLNKVSSARINRNEGTITELSTLVDELPGRQYYHGGRMKFGPEKKYLFITTGAAIYKESQNGSFLGGKILRLQPNGSIPEGNPYDNEVYASGFRNPQGLDFNPKTGTLFISQHGPWRRDNIAKVGKGTNLGWPDECQKSHPGANIGEEVLCTQTWTLAPSGMTFVDDEKHPWYNDLFIAGLRGNQVHRIEFDNKGYAHNNEIFWFNGFQSDGYPNYANRIRDVEFWEDKIWVLHDFGFITQISPKSNN